MIPVMNVARQYENLKTQIDKAVLDVLSSGQYILGKEVEDFEEKFAAYCGVKYAVGVGNGSDALKIALRACGVKTGDEVITTDMSFIATAEAIAEVGATPVFVDCDRSTYTINISEIENKISNKTKAIIPVHIYGQCADMDSITSIAGKYNIKVIEDAAQAVGAEYKGKKAGTMADAGCISFFPTKNLGCAGDGGVIITNNEKIYHMCRAMRVHGSGMDAVYSYSYMNGISIDEVNADFGDNLPKYFNYIYGYNSRLDAIQAAILKVKLPYIDTWNKRRREIADLYNSGISNDRLIKPVTARDNIHTYYVYAIATEKRDSLKEYLREHGIGTGVYFPVPFHKQRVFEGLHLTDNEFPNASFVSNNTLVLPMFPELTDMEIENIIDTANRWRD